MNDYGQLHGVVATSGCIMAAATAIAFAWKRRSSWEPVVQDIPNGAQRVGGLVSAIAIALLWANVRPAHAEELTTWAAVLGGAAVVSLCVYGYLIAAKVYDKEVPNQHGPDRVRVEKVIGGLWLTPSAVRATTMEHMTVRQYFKETAFDVDSVWSRPSRALAHQLFVLSYLGLVSCGTTALAAAAIRIDLGRGTNKPAAVRVPARSDLAALWYRDAKSVDKLSEALKLFQQLEVPPKYQARLVSADPYRWTEDMYQGVLDDLLLKERSVRIDDVCRTWRSFSGDTNKLYDYLVDKWMHVYVARELAEAGIDRPRFTLARMFMLSSFKAWNEQWLVPRMDRAWSSSGECAIELKPSDFAMTSDYGVHNRMLWKRVVGLQLDRDIARYPPQALPLTGRADVAPPLKSTTFPAPNEPAYSLLSARVLQTDNPNVPTLDACRRLAVNDVLEGDAAGSTYYVFGMNDDMPSDNGDGWVALTFQLERAQE